MPDAIDPRELRVSDSERHHVLRLLERATGLGLIDLGEYNERSAKVIASRTRADLNAVLLDLPGLTIGGHSVDEAAAVTAPGAPPRPMIRPDGAADLLDLSGWGSRTFKGHWVAPARILISGTGASTRLDFTQAQLSSRTVTIEFNGNYGGAAEFIVPVGTTVQVDGLQVRGGHLNNKVAPGRGGGQLHLVLTGVKKHGSVTVRNPRQGLFGRG